MTRIHLEMGEVDSVESRKEENEQIVHRNPIRELGFAQIEHVLGLDKDLSDGAYRTLSLLHFFWRQSNKAWPSMRTLCKLRGKKHSAISAQLAELSAKGIISRERRYSRSTITWLEDLPKEYYKAAENHLKQRDIRKNGQVETNVQKSGWPSSEKVDDLIISKEEEPGINQVVLTAPDDLVSHGKKSGRQRASHRTARRNIHEDGSYRR